MKNVSKTLFFTLCSRANDPLFEDPIANQILQQNPDIKRYSPNLLTQKLIVHRAKSFDHLVIQVKRQYPEKKFCLINLGGGLCSRFDRVKNEIHSSIHIDLPEVIDLYNETFATTADHLIPADLNEISWATQVAKLISPEETPIFTMEGVSMYLQKDSLLQLLRSLPENFTQGHIIMDLLHPFFKNKSYLVKDVATVNAKFSSGISHTNEILTLCPKLKLISTRVPFGPKGLPEIFPFNLYQFTTFSWGI